MVAATDGDTSPYYKIKALPCALATSRRLESNDVRRARRRRRHPRPRDCATRRQAVGCGSRSSKPAISAAATSFNHQKTAHGGLRSLRSGDLRRAREVDPRAARAGADRAVAPAAAALPHRHVSLVHQEPAGARARAFRFDAWLGRHRNDGVEPELHLPPPRLISKAATLKLFAGIRRRRPDRRRAVVRLPDGREPTD